MKVDRPASARRSLRPPRAFSDMSISRGRRRAAAPRRGIGRPQLRVLALDRAQLVEQRVVLVVADLGVVEDVVAVAVVMQLLAQLRGAFLRGRAHSTSRAAGASSRPRSWRSS